MTEPSYLDLQRRDDSITGHSLRRYWKGHYVRALPDAAIEVLLARDPSVSASLQAEGGAIADVPDGAAAFSHRGTAFQYVCSVGWTDQAEDETRIAAAPQQASRLEPFASGVYVNVLADEGEIRLGRAEPPTKLARHAALKDAIDPHNVFHLNQNIPPTASRLDAAVDHG